MSIGNVSVRDRTVLGKDIMNILATFKVAFRALARNKLRSVLTMLGIIIGVAAVIAMVSVGQGAQATIQDQISSVGTNILYVWPC